MSFTNFNCYYISDDPKGVLRFPVRRTSIINTHVANDTWTQHIFCFFNECNLKNKDKHTYDIPGGFGLTLNPISTWSRGKRLMPSTGSGSFVRHIESKMVAILDSELWSAKISILPNMVMLYINLSVISC